MFLGSFVSVQEQPLSRCEVVLRFRTLTDGVRCSASNGPGSTSAYDDDKVLCEGGMGASILVTFVNNEELPR